MANAKRAKQTIPAPRNNRLVGWLVSYELDELGQAFELRSGRTLIGSDEVDGNRSIIVEDDTISSPHSALHATRRHQVLIQDIFSDHGTYVRRVDSPREEAVSGPIELDHGDWIRIGETTRLQLCLIEGAK